MILFICNDIVDSHLGSSTGRGGQCNDRNRLLFSRSHAFQRNNIAEFRIVSNDTDRLGSIDGRTATDGQNKICTRSGKCLHSRFHIGDSRIRFDFTEYFVWNACLLQYLQYLVGNTEFQQILVCRYKCFVQTKTVNLLWQHFTRARSEIRHFVQYKSVNHSFFIKLICYKSSTNSR